MELAKRIREKREELGLSQQELAKCLGYKSRSTIGKIESGENDISHLKLFEFAKALKTTPVDLLGGYDLDNSRHGLSSVDEGYLKVIIKAIEKGITPEEMSLAVDFIEAVCCQDKYKK